MSNNMLICSLSSSCIEIDFSKGLLENHIKRHYKVYVDIQVYDNVWFLRVGANLCKICIVFVLYLGDLNNRLNPVIGLSQARICIESISRDGEQFHQYQPNLTLNL
jgi:hypothetical protein